MQKDSFMVEALAKAEKAREKLIKNNLLQPYRKEMTYINALQAIQQKLKAPKNQRNSFWNYNYRSCEDILEAVKPLLLEHNATLTISDEIVECGWRVYVKATATLITEWDKFREATAFAREAEDKKWMDDAQITGSASSYARKYALNGLFCIDDTKDADSTNTHWHEEKPKQSKQEDDDKPRFNDKDFENMKAAIMNWKYNPPSSPDELAKEVRKKYKLSKKNAEKLQELYK